MERFGKRELDYIWNEGGQRQWHVDLHNCRERIGVIPYGYDYGDGRIGHVVPSDEDDCGDTGWPCDRNHCL